MPQRRRDNRQDPPYQVLHFPRKRQLVLDAGWMGMRKHMIHGLLEADVTNARRLIRTHKNNTGERLSFTAFAAACLGHAVERDRRVQAIRNWRNQLIVFDDVDVLVSVETPVDYRTFPLVHPLRAVNRRNVRDLHTMKFSDSNNHRRAVKGYGRSC